MWFGCLHYMVRLKEERILTTCVCRDLLPQWELRWSQEPGARLFLERLSEPKLSGAGDCLDINCYFRFSHVFTSNI